MTVVCVKTNAAVNSTFRNVLLTTSLSIKLSDLCHFFKGSWLNFDMVPCSGSNILFFVMTSY